MFSFLSSKIVHFFILYKAIDKKDGEVYRYGIELILSTVFTTLATLIISLLLNKFIFFLIFYIFFIPLRIFAGGYHASG